MFASLLMLALAAPSIASPFVATFSDLKKIGQSNYTHFWMPAPLTLSSSLPSARLLVHVDLCGDGEACPPPGHPQNSAAYFTAASTGGPWTTSTGAYLGTIIRINATVTRGFGGIRLDPATNTTATCTYEDWIEDGSGHVRSLTPGKAQLATITGLPQMLAVAYFMPSPSAVIHTGSKEVYLTQFYGYIAGATAGCTAVVSRGCYSVVTIASEDKGASWAYKSSIDWDGARMPAHVEGPCESALATMADGKTLLSVFRVDEYQNMWQAVSTDGGSSFSAPSETNAWAVFPELRALPSGALVLTAGRPGIGLWLSDGRSVGAGPEPLSWRFHNLAREHNALAGAKDPSILYPAPELAVVNASSVPSTPPATKAYTGLAFVGCEAAATSKTSQTSAAGCTVAVSYDRLSNGNAGPDPPGPHGPVDAAFTMRVTVTQDPAAAQKSQ